MTGESQVFKDQSGVSHEKPLDLWPSIVISKAEIDAEIERLADLPAPANGRREALIVQPGPGARTNPPPPPRARRGGPRESCRITIEASAAGGARP